MSTNQQTTANTHTHNGEEAAIRGNPSFVWRAGQERRLAMVCRHVELENRRVLAVGCGIGMYTSAFQRYSSHVHGIEIELDRAVEARHRATAVAQAVGEFLPFEDSSFDVVYSHEVLEHVDNDRLCITEMVRVTRPGGHIVVFVPNRLYPFETHGIYWRGTYHFGNVPLINWLPNALRNRLAPHVRAYTSRGLRRLFEGRPVHRVIHTQIYPGYDNIVARHPQLGHVIQMVTYGLEHTPLRALGLSHFLVLKVQPESGT
ncbi:MAG: class I SAM-dependent methyltransferase [Anaerolineae bacterium]|nr:class I SAM-dependent methyltransferase [Anaerolineae bacterium]